MRILDLGIQELGEDSANDLWAVQQLYAQTRAPAIRPTQAEDPTDLADAAASELIPDQSA